MLLALSPFLLGNALFPEWSHECFLFFHGLETTMAKLGGGVSELQVTLQSSSFGHTSGSHHTAFEHDEVIGHHTVNGQNHPMGSCSCQMGHSQQKNCS